MSQPANPHCGYSDPCLNRQMDPCDDEVVIHSELRGGERCYVRGCHYVAPAPTWARQTVDGSLGNRVRADLARPAIR